MARTVLRDPGEIGSDVSSRLFWDSRVDESDIHVDAAQGRVILTGTVPACSDRIQAEEDAYSVAGVSHVDNRLRIRYACGPEAPDDSVIASRIKRVLEWSPHVRSELVEVDVQGGNVTLSGEVDSLRHKSWAQEAACNFTGVLNVRNLLKVKPGRDVSDESIASHIRESLEHNSLIDTGMINVHVKEGVVTLSGTVHSHHASRAAEEIAGNTRGAKDVNNYLVIT